MHFRYFKITCLVRNILSILGKKYSKSVVTSGLNSTTSQSDAPVHHQQFLSAFPELIVDASSTLGLKSKQSLN